MELTNKALALLLIFAVTVLADPNYTVTAVQIPSGWDVGSMRGINSSGHHEWTGNRHGNPGYEFFQWLGNVATPNAAATTITMTAPQTITAEFKQLAHRPLR